MKNKTFEQRIINVLGKNMSSNAVGEFILELKEKPYIDNDNEGFPDIQTDYCFYNIGICFIFDKTNTLSSQNIYLVQSGKYKPFNQSFNDIINIRTTKDDLILRYGIPSRRNDKEFISFGTLTPVWIAYDYNDYTINYGFIGPTSTISEITIMTPKAAPGREKRFKV